MKNLYKYIILKFPILTIILFGAFILLLGSYSSKLEIDASAQTLLLEDDDDLNYFREVSKKFQTTDMLLLTYKPKVELLDDKSLDVISSISKEISELDLVENVVNILNVPLLQSPVREITELVDDVQTLGNGGVDKTLVKEELKTSPLYSGIMVSKDFSTTAIIINIKKDEKYFELLNKRNELLFNDNRTSEENDRLKKIQIEFKEYRDLVRDLESQNIQNIRNIVNKYKDSGELFLGGPSMIASDVIGFIRSDLVVYGSTLVFMFIFILWVIFRQIRWIVFPIFICFVAVVASTGILGFFGWEITVLSSNFIALQLILTISIVLHLIVRYRELAKKYTYSSQYKLVLNTVLSKANPSLFAVVTTIAGFGSLVLSNIRPVIDLGWMISSSILMSLIITFIIFPAVLIKLSKLQPNTKFEDSFSLTKSCATFVENKPKYIFITTVAVMIFAFIGTSKLEVENSFINYFKKSTEIYKGMEIIDRDLGGTTPLDIVIKFKDIHSFESSNDIDDEFSDFEDEFEASSSEEQYWFTKQKMDLIVKVHDYLQNIEHIGSVQSFATMLKVGNTLNNGVDLDGFKLALIYTKLPKEYRDIVVTPFINIEENEVRFFTRVIDSNVELRRDELIKKINSDLAQIISPDEATYRVTNLMVLYNNMLQSLYESQIKTLGFVLLTLFFMFIVLFRSILIAFIAITVNLIPIGIVFGIMGVFSIPLDIMTITIAAISIGIGVDDTIHYIHRFKEEFKKDHNYTNAMIRSHASIGYAMYYTTLVVVCGFSILILSNLVPTIYFGLLTVLVMITMLTSALLLLPKMLIWLKPYKKVTTI
ncbi:efflux RND transporter permease subunit [Arcobacter sp. FWKO B]|uniref:efflux RND transporter permease subunit n=1 Tax=Arcobacter sp. FWKO B TaxID=2593672 RepID=UPI0018A65F0A|nr:MMPL family transporter [Arcobacter sp. FWKO B]QOG13253.1 RND family transporter [Arcobacter sp. FWKO B]